MYYYIVYLKGPKKYLVVPFYWIRDGDTTMLEKFVDRGLNSNQTHLCYWNEQVDAEDYASHVPDFGANISDDFPCQENAACYYCFVLKFKGKCLVRVLHLLCFVFMIHVFLQSQI